MVVRTKEISLQDDGLSLDGRLRLLVSEHSTPPSVLQTTASIRHCFFFFFYFPHTTIKITFGQHLISVWQPVFQTSHSGTTCDICALNSLKSKNLHYLFCQVVHLNHPKCFQQCWNNKKNKSVNLIHGNTAFFHLVACHYNYQGKQQMKCQRVKREAGEHD